MLHPEQDHFSAIANTLRLRAWLASNTSERVLPTVMLLRSGMYQLRCLEVDV